jgi:hypothetical protein
VGAPQELDFAVIAMFDFMTGRSAARNISQTWVAPLFLTLCCLAICSGRAADTVSSEASGSETIVAEARLSLAEARKTHSNPRTAIGHYLQAADGAMRAVNESPVNQASEARLIYNNVCKEVTVLLWSNHELWNKAETIVSNKDSYQLRFAAGARKEGTWDPTYFDLFRTQRQVHEKIAHQEAGINDWGGVLVRLPCQILGAKN